MIHFDEMACLLYLEGQLDQARASELAAHADQCAPCRDLLRALERESQLLVMRWMNHFRLAVSGSAIQEFLHFVALLESEYRSCRNLFAEVLDNIQKLTPILRVARKREEPDSALIPVVAIETSLEFQLV